MSRMHPILFSSPMVEAILAGRKTQTRRLAGLEVINQEPDRYEYIGAGGGYDAPFFAFRDKKADVQVIVKSRYGTTGHILWVREKWQAQNPDGKWWHEVKREERSLHNWAWTNPIRPAFDAVPARWLPGIHMPALACRLWLEVQGVQVERLHEMTLHKMEMEGVPETEDDGRHPLSPFIDLWDSLNGENPFIRNPWVIVAGFKL